jgi:hypothetical protein
MSNAEIHYKSNSRYSQCGDGKAWLEVIALAKQYSKVNLGHVNFVKLNLFMNLFIEFLIFPTGLSRHAQSEFL